VSLFLGLDIGTSAVKAIIVDAEDRERASAEAPLSIERPHPLWSEQHPDVWWTAAAAVLDRLAADHPKLMSGVAALGLSGQMLGVALIDGAGRPIRPAPLWNDGRAAAECAELDATVADFADLAGARPMPGFSAPKILWLSRHEPDAMKRTRHILLTKDYVRLCLTGEAISDRADASATLLMDTRAGVWSTRLAEACGISIDVLPAPGRKRNDRRHAAAGTGAALRLARTSPGRRRRRRQHGGCDRCRRGSCRRCLHQPWHIRRLFRCQ